MEANQVCRLCTYWAKWLDQPVNAKVPLGDCRVSQPQIFESIITRKYQTKWPSTKATDYCGKHAPGEGKPQV